MSLLKATIVQKNREFGKWEPSSSPILGILKRIHDHPLGLHSDSLDAPALALRPVRRECRRDHSMASCGRCDFRDGMASFRSSRRAGLDSKAKPTLSTRMGPGPVCFFISRPPPPVLSKVENVSVPA